MIETRPPGICAVMKGHSVRCHTLRQLRSARLTRRVAMETAAAACSQYKRDSHLNYCVRCSVLFDEADIDLLSVCVTLSARE